MNQQEEVSTVKETIFLHAELQRRKVVSTKNFIVFRRFRELYMKHIGESDKEPGTNICLTSYGASIENTDLQIRIATEWVLVQPIQEIKEDNLIDCVRNRCLRTEDGENLFSTDAASGKVAMAMQIPEAEGRAWSLHKDSSEELRNSSYGDLTTSKPHIAIRNIMERVRPQFLKTWKLDIICWRKNDNFDLKDFKAFMREVALQAKKSRRKRELCLGGGTINLSSNGEMHHEKTTRHFTKS